MFQAEARDYSFGCWLLQQLGAVLVPAIWALATSSVPSAVEGGAGYPIGTILEALWYVFFVWAVGLFWALIVHRFLRHAASAGRWVWPLPTFCFLLWFTFLAVERSFGYALRAAFSVGQGEEGWGVAVVTYPTCQCILYSLGMYLASRYHSGPDQRLAS